MPQELFWIAVIFAAGFQVWMIVCRPEQYEREVERRDRYVRGAANATAKIATFFLSRR
jgi:hypothetical protein